MTTLMIDEQAASGASAETESAELGRSVARGFAWSLGGTLFSKFGGLASGLVLARLLAPSDFGMYAVAIAATQFVMMIKDLGVHQAMQHWRGPLDKMIPTATTISVAFCTVTYLVFFVGASSFATLAGNPDAAPVIRLLTAVTLIYGFNAVPSGVLQREFRHHRLVAANVIGLVVNSAVAMSLAAAGAGAMSFAAGQVAGVAVLGIMVFAFAGVPLRFGFDRAIAKQLLRFGLPLAGAMALEAVLLNIDFVVIGRMLDPKLLGFYLLAFNISSWALSTLTSTISYVAVAGFARLSELDPATFTATAQRSISKLYLIVAPVGALTAALATPVVVVLYGDSWEPAALVLRFLAVLTVVRVMISLANDMFVGVGATRSMVMINGVWAAALIPAMIVGVGHGGIHGAGISHAAVGLGLAIPLTVVALRHRGIHLAPVLPSLVRPTIGSALAALVALSVCGAVEAPPMIQLLMAGTFGLLTYVLVAVPLGELRKWRASGSKRWHAQLGRRRAVGAQAHVG